MPLYINYLILLSSTLVPAAAFVPTSFVVNHDKFSSAFGIGDSDKKPILMKLDERDEDLVPNFKSTTSAVMASATMILAIFSPTAMPPFLETQPANAAVKIEKVEVVKSGQAKKGAKDVKKGSNSKKAVKKGSVAKKPVPSKKTASAKKQVKKPVDRLASEKAAVAGAKDRVSTYRDGVSKAQKELSNASSEYSKSTGEVKRLQGSLKSAKSITLKNNDKLSEEKTLARKNPENGGILKSVNTYTVKVAESKASIQNIQRELSDAKKLTEGNGKKLSAAKGNAASADQAKKGAAKNVKSEAKKLEKAQKKLNKEDKKKADKKNKEEKKLKSELGKLQKMEKKYEKAKKQNAQSDSKTLSQIQKKAAELKKLEGK